MMTNPFVPQKIKYDGVPTGEQYYITKEILLKFVQSGVDEKGEPIGEMIPKVNVIKTDIDLLINSHKDEVGVKNLIKLFNKTGDYSLFQAKTALPDGDYTEAFTAPEELLKRLPPELVGNKSVEEFIKTLTPEQFQAWVDSLTPASTEKQESEVTE